jgi:hypothetical protein
MWHLNALHEVVKNADDSNTKCKAESTVHYKLQNFEFLVAFLWYFVSKTLQTNKVQLRLALMQIKGLLNFLQKYR